MLLLKVGALARRIYDIVCLWDFYDFRIFANLELFMSLIISVWARKG